MKHLVSKAGRTVEVDFLGDKVEVRVLSTRQLKDFQSLAKKYSEGENPDDETQLQLQNDFIRIAVVGAEEMTDDELESFAPSDIEELMAKAFEINNININKDTEGDSSGN